MICVSALVKRLPKFILVSHAHKKAHTHAVVVLFMLPNDQVILDYYLHGHHFLKPFESFISSHRSRSDLKHTCVSTYCPVKLSTVQHHMCAR